MKIARFVVILFLLFFIGFNFYNTVFGALGNEQIVRVRIPRNSWSFSPDVITIKSGKPTEIRIYNEDSYQHGFFIEELAINTELPAKTVTKIKIQTEKTGTFNFFCSFICGMGHYRMVGELRVIP